MDIESLINIELENINEKIKGTTYLEKLKYNLIEKIDQNQIYKNNNLHTFEKKIKSNENTREIIISALQLKNPIINLNQTLIKDTLLLSIFGMIKIDLFDQKKTDKTKKIILMPKMGICLPKNSLLNIDFSKNSYILKIESLENDNNIENGN